MAGVDDNVALLGELSSPCLSLEAWFSTIFEDNNGVRPNLTHLEENKYDGYFHNTRVDMMLSDISTGQANDNNPFSEEKNIGGGLAERLAARAEFNAPRLNIESIRSSKSITNSNVQSPSLAIPPGFSPTALLESPSFLQNSVKTTISPHEQSIVGNEVSLQSDHSVQSENSEPAKDIFLSSIEKSNGKSIAATNARVNIRSPLDGQQIENGLEESGNSTIFNVAHSEDGYTWRKYGQKQVKGCEYPRNYYKCTQLDCPVKKKVERSEEGHITKIIYKGSHNHPPPQPSHRLVIGSSSTHDFQFNFPDQDRERICDDRETVWVNIQKGCSLRTLERRNDNIEVTSSAYLGHELHNSKSSSLPQNENPLESNSTIDALSIFSEGEDEGGTYGSASLAYDGKGEESQSKRRKIEFELHGAEMMGAIRTNGKPRVVVQTTSEVDIIDDGYRWRKYGQKVVKGNPNPRSYYKCTNHGCDVRKHVERASQDLKSVITTYEGKHNHAVPPARKNSHHNSCAAAAVAEQIMSQTTAATVQSQVYRPEPPQIRNNLPMSERSKPMDSLGFPRASQLGTSPGFSFGTSTSRLATMPMDHGLRSNQERMHVHQLFAQHPINDTGFMLPRGDPTVETMPKTFLNQSNSSSLYGKSV